jgi:hypothetical protein
MVAKQKRDPVAPLSRVIESVQDNESYLWDTTLGLLYPLGLSTLHQAVPCDTISAPHKNLWVYMSCGRIEQVEIPQVFTG